MAVKTVSEAKELLSMVVVSEELEDALAFLVKHAQKDFAPSSKQMYVITKELESADLTIQEVKEELGLDNPDSDTLDKKQASKVIDFLKNR